MALKVLGSTFCLSKLLVSSTIRGVMPSPTLMAVLIAVLGFSPVLAAKQKPESLPAAPIGWIYLEKGATNFTVPEEDFRRERPHLAWGTICPVFKTKQKRGGQWARIRAFNFATGLSQLGWLDADPARILPPQTYPVDADLLRALGEPFLDDFAADHTSIARFLVHQGHGPAVLVCYVYTEQLAIAKLVVFTPSQGKYVAGHPVDFSINDMKSGITSLEVRDLLGNKDDCLIAREPFRNELQNQGANLIIRRVVGSGFQTVWQAPVEFRNLSQYRPKMEILEPPESNIGKSGTVTTGDVTFRPQGKGEEPVWKGTVDFFVVGRDKPLDSVTIEKACPWDGKEFKPLR